jgi:hypothetical protein
MNELLERLECVREEAAMELSVAVNSREALQGERVGAMIALVGAIDKAREVCRAYLRTDPWRDNDLRCDYWNKSAEEPKP